MSLAINGHGDLSAVSFNGLSLNYVYFNGDLVWPDEVNFIGFKYVSLGRVTAGSVDEIAYELHLSTRKLDADYKYSLITEEPEWQNAQPNVVGLDGKPYASPTAYTIKVVIDTLMMPSTMFHWFSHLYGGFNNTPEFEKKYPFKGEGFDKFSMVKLTSLRSAFSQCHVPEIDLSTGNTADIVDMTEMFSKADVKHIYVGNKGNTDNVVESDNMFELCIYLRNFSDHGTDKTKAHTGGDGYLEKKA